MAYPLYSSVMSAQTHDINVDEAEPLTGEALSVRAERTPRLIQTTRHDSPTSSLNSDWLADLGLLEQSAPSRHFFVTGALPVVITEPAIVIQPDRR